MKLRKKHGHDERDITIKGEYGSEFKIILRKSQFNPLNFSVILAYQLPNTSQLFRLRRYNGKHEHTNKLEKEKFYDFHIHQATERYQDSGFREDAFAEPTEKFSDFDSAIECLIDDCGFIRPDEEKMTLFSQGE